MARPTLEIEDRGLKRSQKSLTDMGARAQDVRRAAYAVRTVFRKAEEHRFDSKGAGSWPALAASTLERDVRGNRDPRILRATGALYRSLTATRASGQVDRREPHELAFGTSLFYAHFHEQGAGVPQRVLIDLTDRERREINDKLAAYIARNET